MRKPPIRPGMGDKKPHDYPPAPKVYYDEEGRPHKTPPRRERVKRADGSTWIKYNPNRWDKIKDPIIGDDESLKRTAQVGIEDVTKRVRAAARRILKKRR